MKDSLLIAVLVVVVWFILMYVGPELGFSIKCDMDTNGWAYAAGAVFASSLLAGYLNKRFDLQQYL